PRPPRGGTRQLRAPPAFDNLRRVVTHLDHPPGEPVGQAALTGDERYLNRELSWLEFNARVLALADDPQVPLLERVKFLAIFSSNLDEFFQVRVAALKDMVAGKVGS